MQLAVIVKCATHKEEEEVNSEMILKKNNKYCDFGLYQSISVCANKKGHNPDFLVIDTFKSFCVLILVLK